MADTNRLNYTQYTDLLGTKAFLSRGDYEPQRTNNFEMQIIGLDTIWKAGTYPANGDTWDTVARESNNYHGYGKETWNKIQAAIDGNYLTLALRQGFTPKESVGTLSVSYGNTKTKFAGTLDYPDGSISYIDYYDHDMEVILKAWFQAAGNSNTGAIGHARNYKLKAYVTMFAPDGTVARRWAIHNCWTNQVNGDDFSNEGNNIRGLAANIVYDWCERLPEWNSEADAPTGIKAPK